MDSDQNSAETLLQEGISASKAGNKELARKCFLKAARAKPRHDLIWLCLASVTDSLQMRLNYLNKVRELNPGDTKAEGFLRVTRVQFAEELVVRGTAAAKQGDAWQATHCFLHAAELDPTNENAWLGLAGLDNPPEAVDVLVWRVLEINPSNEKALALKRDLDAKAPKETTAESAPLEPRAAEPPPATPIKPPYILHQEGPKEVPPAAPVAADTPLIPETLVKEPEWIPPQLVSEKPAETFKVDGGTKIDKADSIRERSFEEERIPDDVLLEGEVAATPATNDLCPLCDRELGEFTLQCDGCGGLLLPSAFIDRLGENETAGFDRRQILLAAARYGRTIAADPDDASAHYKLGIAYLNLRHTEAALRSLRRSCELRPDATLAAEILHLSRTQTKEATNVKAERAIRHSLEEFEAGSRRCVLVIDDSPTVRKVVATTLEKHGYHVVAAVDGYDGLAKLAHAKPDVVFLDVMMPKMDGYEVCKTIRDKSEDLPVIMLSGKDGLFDKMRGKMSGCTAYITKPFDNKILVDTVRKYCSAA